jgi:hypothetical protein
MIPVVTYVDQDLYSAAVGSEVFAYQLPRAIAAAAIVAKVDTTLAQANAWLNSPVSPEVWRATHLAALTNSVSVVSDEIAAIQDRELAAKLETRIDTAMAMLAEIDQRLAIANQLADQANRVEADKLAAMKRDAARQEAEAKAQAEAKAKSDREYQAKLLLAKDRRVDVFHDGSVSITEAAYGSQRGRNVIAKYPNVEAARAAGVPV